MMRRSGVLSGQRDKADVQDALDQLADDPIGSMPENADGDGRVARPVFFQHRREHVEADGFGRPDGQPDRRTAQVGYGLNGLAAQVQHPLCVFQQNHAWLGQVYASSQTVEEPVVNFFLDLPHLRADSWLGQTQRFGGPRKAAQTSHLNHRADLVKIHGRCWLSYTKRALSGRSTAGPAKFYGRLGRGLLCGFPELQSGSAENGFRVPRVSGIDIFRNKQDLTT